MSYEKKPMQAIIGMPEVCADDSYFTPLVYWLGNEEITTLTIQKQSKSGPCKNNWSRDSPTMRIWSAINGSRVEYRLFDPQGTTNWEVLWDKCYWNGQQLWNSTISQASFELFASKCLGLSLGLRHCTIDLSQQCPVCSPMLKIYKFSSVSNIQTASAVACVARQVHEVLSLACWGWWELQFSNIWMAEYSPLKA